MYLKKTPSLTFVSSCNFVYYLQIWYSNLELLKLNKLKINLKNFTKTKEAFHTKNIK
jgi:hypothetical protein